jgi:type IV pilus assembly protein PilV
MWELMMKMTCRSRGLTLIEVLVALVVLAFGVLGVAALQTHGLRNVKVSGDVQAATLHVNELAELMRLNRDNITDYNNLNYTSCVSPSTAQLALNDFCNVLGRLQAVMPASDVRLSITNCNASGALCRLDAEWVPRETYGTTVSASTVSYGVDVQL